MTLDNDIATNGAWQAREFGDGGDFTGLDVYLGASACDNYDETSCFADYIGEFVVGLRYPPDVIAWNAHYDAASPCGLLSSC
jgi:hypothetical protein